MPLQKKYIYIEMQKNIAPNHYNLSNYIYKIKIHTTMPTTIVISMLNSVPQQSKDGEEKRRPDDSAGGRQRERISGVGRRRRSLSGSYGGECRERNECVR